jgi:arylformamidase
MYPCFLSYFLDEQTPAYGGGQSLIQFERTRSVNKGDMTNELRLSFPNHIGTHIDFPYHFHDEGKKCIDYSAAQWIFNKVGLLKCSIEEVPSKIAEIPPDIELLLLKTGFGEKRDQPEYWAAQPVIPAHFAKLFRSRFPLLRVFGFDLISLTSKLDRAEGRKAHLAFLVENNILILEDMNLSSLHTTPGAVIVSPLLVAAADGVPCTVIALEQESHIS